MHQQALFTTSHFIYKFRILVTGIRFNIYCGHRLVCLFFNALVQSVKHQVVRFFWKPFNAKQPFLGIYPYHMSRVTHRHLTLPYLMALLSFSQTKIGLFHTPNQISSNIPFLSIKQVHLCCLIAAAAWVPCSGKYAYMSSTLSSAPNRALVFQI